MKILIIGGIILINLFFFPGREENTIRYMETPIVPGEIGKILPLYTDFNDTISGDTLYLQFTTEGLPQSAYRKISTNVCIDSQCRRLEITVFWDITGRYLGFELPPGEFLSKSEHKPFSDVEYKQLHTLLSDPYSPLAGYSLEQLVPSVKGKTGEVDAVTSATVKEVLTNVVEGAVYTSYTLWHIVHGNTKNEVQKLGLHYFSEELAMLILDSPGLDGKIWMLNILAGKKKWNEKLQQKVLLLINNRNFYLSERAINSFGPELMASEEFQNKLFTVFESSDYAVKRLIIQKFSKAPFLSEEVKARLASRLSGFKDALAQNVLDLFIQHRVDDLTSCSHISELLDHKNRFLARKAFNYLDQRSIDDRKIRKRLKAYNSK